MTSPAAWFAEIAQAADDLGYHIAELSRAGEVVLVPKHADRDMEQIVIRSMYLSGVMLRRRLLPFDPSAA